MNVSFFGEKLICQSLLTIHTCGLKKTFGRQDHIKINTGLYKGEIINIKHKKTYKIRILTVQKFMFVIIIREYIDIVCI